MQHNIETKTKSHNTSDDLIMKRRQESSNGTNKKEMTFENYLKKFEPSTIWEQLDKQKKYKGLILTKEEHSEILMKAMDPTDEIMEFKVENGNPKLIFDKDGRRQLGWKPPAGPGPYRDRFYYRSRIYELMKQAIYTTRNKLVVMQLYRARYRNSSLYKMGFLMSKADNAAKTFGKFSYRAYRGCLLARERALIRLPVWDLLSVNERQLNLWFNIEILADLIYENDRIVRNMFKTNNTNRIELMDQSFIE